MTINEIYVFTIENVKHTEIYITKKTSYGAIYGLFVSLHTMTHEKQNSGKKDKVMDLGWPKITTVNSGVLKKKLGFYFLLKIPFCGSIDSGFQVENG